MYIYIYICIYVCLLPIAYYCLLPVASGGSAGAAALRREAVLCEFGFMRHGHEMLWFLRWSFSASELFLSYNAKVQNTRTQLIGSEINLLNKV